MIDLHIHTTASDGSDEPKEILIKAQEADLQYISITDHDSIEAYQKLEKLNIKDYFSGKIIPGCEFSVAYKGTAIEILGYGVDFETIEATGIVSEEKFYERENENLKKMMEIFNNLGIKYNKALSINEAKHFANTVLYFDMKRYPENQKHFSKEVWQSCNAFYRTCVTNESSPFFLNHLKNYPTIEEITKIIRKAGGQSFLAHLYGYYVDNHEEFLDSIIALDQLDGIECYHSLHSMDKTRFLLDYCKKHNLLITGGSDYHGIIKPDVKIGESINGERIPFEIAESWLHSYIK